MPTVWFPANRSAEGLEVLEDGTIKLSALRASGQTYLVEMDAVNPLHIKKITARKIRLSAAIPLDHAVRATYKLPTDPSSLPTGGVTAADCTDIEPGRIRQYAAQAGVLSKRWLRKNSWTTPESVKQPDGTATPKAPDKLGANGSPTDALRDDTQSLMSQAYRRLGEVGRCSGHKSIFLKGVLLSQEPGDMIQAVGQKQVRKCVMEVILHTGNDTQITEAVLG